MLLIMLLIGIYLATLEPGRRQWAAVALILKRGGSVETTPSNVPGASLFLPGGGGNIEAVFFNRQPATDETIKVLKQLPHLRRLYLERTDLQPHHLDTIGTMTDLQRLSIWGQGKQFNDTADFGKLASLKNLEKLDIHFNKRTDEWRRLVPLTDIPNLEVEHSFYFPQPIRSEDVEDLCKFRNWLDWRYKIQIEGLTANELMKVYDLFPDLGAFEVLVSGPVSSELLNQLLVLQEKGHIEVKYRIWQESAGPLWTMLGSVSDELEIRATDDIYNSPHHIVFHGTTERGFRFSVKIVPPPNKPSHIKVTATFFDDLPDLVGIKTFKLREPSSGNLYYVVKNCPNVEHLICHASKFSPFSRRDKLPYLQKVKRVTILHLDTYLDGSPVDLEEKCYEIFPNLEEYELLYSSHGGG